MSASAVDTRYLASWLRLLTRKPAELDAGHRAKNVPENPPTNPMSPHKLPPRSKNP